MGKPIQERSHGKAIKRAREARKISDEQAAREKNARRRARNNERKAERRKQAEERQEYWQSLTHEEQLKRLLSRPGESKRQYARIAQQMDV